MPHEKFINPWGPGGKYWPPKWMEENVLTKDLQEDIVCKQLIKERAEEILEQIKNQFNFDDIFPPFTEDTLNNILNSLASHITGVPFVVEDNDIKCCGQIMSTSAGMVDGNVLGIVKAQPAKGSLLTEFTTKSIKI